MRRRAIQILSLLFLVTPRSASAADLVYRFIPGDRLVYQRQTETTTLDGSAAATVETEQVELWCLGREGGSVTLLVDLIRVVDGRGEPMRAAIITVDNLGHIVPEPNTAPRLLEVQAALDLLRPLPTPIQRPADWQAASAPFGLEYRSARAPQHDRPDNLAFTFTRIGPESWMTLGLPAQMGTFWFSLESGSTTRLEIQSDDARLNQRTRSVTELISATRKPPEWLGRRTVELRRYLQAVHSEDEVLQRVLAAELDPPTAVDRLRRIWSAFLSEVEQGVDSPFATLGNAALRRLANRAPEIAAFADLAARWARRPAAAFSLPDINGGIQTSERLRRGVTIEAFWSADTFGELAALDVALRLRDQLVGKPVTILCLNLDRDPQRAARAIQTCGGPLIHLVAGPLRGIEPIPVLPVFRLLDARGVVREIWCGWQPDERAMLESVRKLME